MIVTNFFLFHRISISFITIVKKLKRRENEIHLYCIITAKGLLIQVSTLFSNYSQSNPLNQIMTLMHVWIV